jgi:DNA-binding CsgD family transcriptional regulator
MIDTVNAQVQAPQAWPHRSTVYTGPERRTGNRDAGPWITQMLDEVDYGMLLVSADTRVTYLNHAARLELDADHPLQLQGRSQLLGAHRPQDVAPLYDALAASQRGLRKLLTMGDGEHRVAVSVVPLPDMSAAMRGEASGVITLLMLGKREVCAQLSVRGYARSQNLTPAETRVLELLCRGLKPTAIAEAVGVAVSTVRTQIGSIRAKTGAASIRDLVRQVAVLPPLVGALRSNGPVIPVQS